MNEHPSVVLTGSLCRAMANAVVAIHREAVGRGPTKAQVLRHRELVVVLMRDTLTTAERSLIADGRHEAVLRLRREFAALMQPTLIEGVERLTGAHVVAYLNANHLDRDVTAEIFLLDRPVTIELAEPTRTEAPPQRRPSWT
jgi:uncharacterized protein YbcI